MCDRRSDHNHQSSHTPAQPAAQAQLATVAAATAAAAAGHYSMERLAGGSPGPDDHHAASEASAAYAASEASGPPGISNNTFFSRCVLIKMDGKLFKVIDPLKFKDDTDKTENYDNKIDVYDFNGLYDTIFKSSTEGEAEGGEEVPLGAEAETWETRGGEAEGEKETDEYKLFVHIFKYKPEIPGYGLYPEGTLSTLVASTSVLPFTVYFFFFPGSVSSSSSTSKPSSAYIIPP